MKHLTSLSLALGGFLILGPGCTKEGPTGSVSAAVHLIDAGSEPRRPIRYRIAPGSEQRSVLTLFTDVDVTLNGVTRPKQRFPGQRLTVEIKTEEVGSDGVGYGFVLSEVELIETAGVSPALVSSLESAVAKLVGLGGSARVSDRGVVMRYEFSPGKDSDSLVQQMLGVISHSVWSATNPLPEEPIGVGAKWEVTSDKNLNGMTIAQTAVYELKEWDGSRGRMTVSIRQRGKPQDFAPPGLAAGTAARLHSHQATGSGELELDTSQLVPVTSNVEISSETDISIGPQNQVQRMVTRTKARTSTSRP